MGTNLELFSDTGTKQEVVHELVRVGGVYMTLKSDICPEWDGVNSVPLLRLFGTYLRCKSKRQKRECLMEWRDNNYTRFTPAYLTKVRSILTKAVHPILEEFIHSLIELFGEEHIMVPTKPPGKWAHQYPHGIARKVPAEDDYTPDHKDIFEEYVLHPRLTSHYEPR